MAKVEGGNFMWIKHEPELKFLSYTHETSFQEDILRFFISRPIISLIQMSKCYGPSFCKREKNDLFKRSWRARALLNIGFLLLCWVLIYLLLSFFLPFVEFFSPFCWVFFPFCWVFFSYHESPWEPWEPLFVFIGPRQTQSNDIDQN